MKGKGKVVIKDMSLLQCLNALEVLDRRITLAKEERVDFMQEHAMREGATENGALMAHLWIEDSLTDLKFELRDKMSDKFKPAGDDE